MDEEHAHDLSDPGCEDDAELGERESGVRQRPAAPTPGVEASARFGSYELLEPLGSGAMGNIYRARHVLLDRLVAIKVLRSELADDQAHVARFVAEARAVNLLRNPHVIDVMDIALESDGERPPWLVMELLEGHDLAKLLLRQRIELRRTLHIVRQVCTALEAIHRAGIVHRDIKPENVFLTQQDGRDFVKLIDFGIARLAQRSAVEGDHTNGPIGTPRYMAPEQISGEAIDHRSDLYGVGSLLYEMISGHTPLDASELSGMMRRVLFSTPPPVSSRVALPTVVRDDLDCLLARCLAKSKDERPESAHEVIEAIDRIDAQLAELPPCWPTPRFCTPVAFDIDLPLPDEELPALPTEPRRASGFAYAALGALFVIALSACARFAIEAGQLPWW